MVDGHLIIFAQQGVVAVAEATPEGYREKARLRISDHGSDQAPGFAAGRIWVRNFTDIASLGRHLGTMLIRRSPSLDCLEPR